MSGLATKTVLAGRGQPDQRALADFEHNRLAVGRDLAGLAGWARAAGAAPDAFGWAAKAVAASPSHISARAATERGDGYIRNLETQVATRQMYRYCHSRAIW